jgi:hypothetical protein
MDDRKCSQVRIWWLKPGIGESAGTNLQNQVANVQLTSTVYDTQREAENKYRTEPRFHPARDSK